MFLINQNTAFYKSAGHYLNFQLWTPKQLRQSFNLRRQYQSFDSYTRFETFFQWNIRITVYDYHKPARTCPIYRNCGLIKYSKVRLSIFDTGSYSFLSNALWWRQFFNLTDWQNHLVSMSYSEVNACELKLLLLHLIYTIYVAEMTVY